ncbi:MAG: glycoside hydrolase family 32 protein [Clostridia bacterium]|nr:glycoside hydrolase family 32 protein [Clostridia bacterium]
MDYLQPLRRHFKPQRGWINDPNGLVYYKGYYHAFYQHAPDYEIPWQQPMHWGHARTKDFLTWEELPVALYPDAWYDAGGCWSGTALVKDGTLYLFYASIHTPAGAEKHVESVSVAYSTDGIHFEKYEKNPVIASYPADGSPDFRDPAVTCINGIYYCVMASGNADAQAARLLLYESSDLFDWQYKGIMCEWQGYKYAECPSFLQVGDSFLLTASVYRSGYHYFSVMYGDFTNGVFTPHTISEVDKGPDQYAGLVFSDPRGRAILMSWIPGWKYKGYAARDVGCLSIPRELFLKDGKIYCYPIEEIRHLLTDSDPALTRTEDGFVIERTGRDPVIHKGEITELKMLCDGYVLEVFVNGGETTYTVLL